MAPGNLVSIDLSSTDHVPEGAPLRAAADMLRSRIAAVTDTVGDLGAAWRRVPDLYQGTDEDETLYTAFETPHTGAEDLRAMVGGLAAALEDLAGVFDRIRERRAEIAHGPERRQAEEETLANMRGNTLKSPEPVWDITMFYSPLAWSLIADAARLDDELHAAEAAFADAVRAAMGLWTLGTPAADLGGDDTSRAADAAEKLADGVATPDEVTAFYQRLAALSPGEIAALVAMHPRLRTLAPPLPQTDEELRRWPTGEAGAAWWNSLSYDQQKALVEEMPGIVTNTEGVAYADRSAAGEVLLDLLAGDVDLSDLQRQDLKGLRESLDPSSDILMPEDKPSIVSLRLDGDERVLAAVALGDLDTAVNIAFNVPGMGTEVRDMHNLVKDSASAYMAMEGTSALVAWIGYDTPNDALDFETLGATAVLSNEKAAVGARALALAADGFADARRHNDGYLREVLQVDPATVSEDPHITMMAHSYGTPTLAIALTLTRHTVDDAVFYGTIGFPKDRVQHASDLNVERDAAGRPNVYTTLAFRDPVAAGGYRGALLRDPESRVMPTAAEFGAKTFSSDGDGAVEGRHATTFHGMIEGANNGEDKNSADRKFGYLEKDSESLYAIAEVLNGKGQDVPTVEQSSWDDLAERLAKAAPGLRDGVDWLRSVDPVRHAPVIDAWQEARGRLLEEKIDTRNAVIDAAQESLRHRSVVGDVLLEAVQVGAEARDRLSRHLSDGVVDGVQAAARGGKESFTAVGEALGRHAETFADGGRVLFKVTDILLDEGINVRRLGFP